MARAPATVAEGTSDLARTRPNLPAAELQQLWFACLRREWSSLVVIPAHSGGSSLYVARSLAEVGGLHRNNPIKLIAAEGNDLTATSKLIIDMTGHVASGGLVIVALDSVVQNQAGIPIALAADAALLVVTYGESDLESARKTLDIVGHDRFVGTVSFQSSTLK
jgi:hypothetical protein